MVNNGPTNINGIFVMAEIQRSTVRLCYIMIQIFEIQYDKIVSAYTHWLNNQEIILGI